LLLSVAAALAFAFNRNLIDFPVYYVAGQSLLAGRVDLYSQDFALGRVMDYRYPPLFLVALLPLWLLPYSIASWLWCVAGVFEAAGCVWVVSKLTTGRLGAKIWLVAALVSLQYFVMVLHYGNAHLLVVFLMFASVYLVFAGRNFKAAASMGLAITVKLIPVLLIPYLALKRKLRFALLVCVLVAILNLLPASYFGFNKNLELLETWYRHVVAGQEFHEANGPINLSLKGQLRRYLTEVDYSSRVDGDVNYRAVNVASLSPVVVDRSWLLLSGILFACSLALILWARPRAPDGLRSSSIKSEQGISNVALEVGLMICVMLLIGPLTSKIYFIALLWPVVALANFAFGSTTRAAKFAKLTLVLAAITNSVLPLLPGRSIQRLLLVLGVDFYVNLLLTVALAAAVISRSLPQSGFAGRQTEVQSEARTS
jgi:hypothetical protein